MSEHRFSENRLLGIRTFDTYGSALVYYSFYCPGCERCHTVRVGEGQNIQGWTFDGNEDYPTFSPSILVHDVKNAETDPTPLICHSFVKDGKIQFFNDCSHSLAGKTVDMISIPI